MNIQQFWPAELPEVLQENTIAAWSEILIQRKEVYAGFCRIEEQHGFLTRSASLATSQGQEMIRILTMRMIEEILEMMHSGDPRHVKEEVIDAFNYGIMVALLDSSITASMWSDLLRKCRSGFEHDLRGVMSGPSFEQAAFMGLLDQLHSMLEKLRNRAWQNRSQSTYFDGWPQVLDFAEYLVAYIAIFFSDWEEFVSFYLAKQSVLTFRIETKY